MCGSKENAQKPLSPPGFWGVRGGPAREGGVRREKGDMGLIWREIRRANSREKNPVFGGFWGVFGGFWGPKSQNPSYYLPVSPYQLHNSEKVKKSYV